MGIGIVFGLLTACFQALAYFFSRHFLMRHGSPARLLVASQLALGAISAVLLPLTTPPGAVGTAQIGPLLLCSLCFIAGQVFFFQALRRIEASRIASLLGLKVVLVPLFLYIFFDQMFNRGQILALVLAVLAALLMNYQGGRRFQWEGMGVCALALLGYAWSDIGVRLLVASIPVEGMLRAALIGTNLNNVFVALVLLPAVWWMRLKAGTIRDALPYALWWGGGVLCFFVCFGYLGAAFGNIVQAARGPVTLVLGIVLSRMGFSYLEAKVPAAVWLRRGAAALLMFGAILIYAFASR